ncbi:MAG: peptidase M16 [Bacteroidetes bacterium GWF2_40_14]|nr:MAG: peptidase M16 [Bacteroidetes bacterium GWF2_40_14]
MSKLLKSLFFTSLAMVTLSCAPKEPKVELNYEQYTLENGLKVILHEDHSDPLVAIAIQYHVGSGREKPGKTGFAHFFEHMLFQRSENLPRNAFFQNIAKMGGSFNGSTNSDGTNYYEAVPRDALEKVLWMESDRMGFFINTVTQDGLEREIDIVSNEKRQNYDSQPYGHSATITAYEMFPAGHPYSWTTIGEIADLKGATLDDVKEFYGTYYVPNNATLVLTGDFDLKQTKELVQKYFGEIKKGADVPKPVIQPLVMDSTKKIVWEDAYARLPQLSVAFPTVEAYNKDAYALQYFASLFANGKNSPLYKIVVEEKKLAPSVSAYNQAREVAGVVQIGIRAFDGINLNDVNTAIEEAFARFEKDGVNPQELQKLKVMQEVSLYNRLSGVQGKALMMARDNEFAGKPDASFDDLKKYQAVTKEDIMAVYEKYFKGKPYFALSVVPRGKQELALTGSVPGKIVEENVADQKMKSAGGKIVDDEYVRTPSAFDRSVEPAYMPNTPAITVPPVWTGKLANGMGLFGITQNELPIIQVSIELKGGMLLDPANKIGLSFINAELMNEGTALKTPEELENAMGLLGARITVSSDVEGMGISISCLAKNFKEVMALTEEMVLQPRFDEAALARIKNEIKSYIRQSSVDPAEIATSVTNKLLFGADSRLAQIPYGNMESLDSITIDDVKTFYNSFLSPTIANFNIAGAIDQATCEKAIASLVEKWAAKEVTVPQPAAGVPAKRAQIYFVDYPNAPQSMIMISKVGMPFSSPDYYPSVIANYRLGAGSQGMLFDVLRLQKGFTYGAYSRFAGQEFLNTFTASSSVQGSTTKEAVETFKSLISNYGTEYNEELLNTTKNSMLRAKASSFETIGALVEMLSNISSYNLPFDYVKQQEETINSMTVEQAKAVIAKNIDANEMVYVVVGDAKTQLKPLNSIGLGNVILIDKEAKSVQTK